MFKGFCVGEETNSLNGRFDLLFAEQNMDLSEAFMIHSSSINNVHFCLMPTGKQLIYLASYLYKTFCYNLVYWCYMYILVWT